MFWKRAAGAAEPKRGLPILVVIELSGGNDGLNTVVPYADDLYAKARPTLRIEPKSVLKLDDRVGLNPALKDLHKIWESGDLTMVQGAGYPNPNRSHSRSMEIWQTGEVGPVPDAGWLGRIAEMRLPLRPCYVGSEATPLAVRGRKSCTPAIASLSDYRVPPGMTAPADRTPPVQRARPRNPAPGSGGYGPGQEARSHRRQPTEDRGRLAGGAAVDNSSLDRT